MSETDFGQHAVDIAREIWGDPNPRLTNKVKVVWGSGGSMTVNIDKGVFYDFENHVGGGVLDMIIHGVDSVDTKEDAITWMVEHGYLEKPSTGHSEHSEAPPAGDRPPEHRQEPEPPKEQPKDDGGKQTPVCGYNYVTADGDPLYQVVRYQWKLPDGSWRLTKTGSIAKTFRQRRKDERGETVWNLDGLTHTIYRHPQVEIAIAEGRAIFIPEGEKDVDNLVALGLEATTNSGGAKNWTPALAALFRDADVIIPIDNDDVGRAAGELKAATLTGIAGRIRVLDLAKFWPEIGPKEDISDYLETHSLQDLAGIINQLDDWTPPPEAPRVLPPTGFGAVRMADMATSKIVYDWLVKGLVERGGVFIVAGEKSSGKSFFMIDMGMKIARGLSYGDRKTKQGLVIHMACEDGRGVQMRAEGYRRDQGISPDEDIPFIVMDRNFTLMDDNAVDKFIAEAKAWEAYYGMKLELITIDTFSVATEGLDEINGGEVGRVLSRVNRISTQTGAAVCIVHHLNGKGDRVRGHSSLTANVSQVIEIRQMTEFQTKRDAPTKLIKDSNGRVVRQAVLEKNKNGEGSLTWRFVLRQIPLGLDEDDFPISTCVCEKPSSEVSSQAKQPGRLTADQKMVLDALKSATEDAGIPMPAGVKVGPQIKLAAPQKAFVAALRKVWPFRNPPDEIEKQARELADVMARTTKSLIAMGFMGRDNDKGILWHLGKDDRRREEPRVRDRPPAEPDEDDGIGAPF